MMAQMGWTPGQGLGRTGTGIRAPVEAVSIARGAGIGAATALTAEAGETYMDRLKRIQRARYDASVYEKKGGGLPGPS